MTLHMNDIALKRSRAKLLIVIGCFVIPLVVAVAGFYLFPKLFLSKSTVNHAVLVHPAQPLEPFTNLRLDGSEVTLETLQRKWTIVHQLGNSCDEGCGKSLYNTRQVREALGKDSLRVQRIIIGSDVRLLDSVSETHPLLRRVLRITEGLETQLVPIIQQYELGQNDALLIDPLGNVMMAIKEDLNPSDLLKDLKKLLRLSKIG